MTPFQRWWNTQDLEYATWDDCWNAALEWAAGQFRGESARFGFEADLPQIRADILAGEEPEK